MEITDRRVALVDGDPIFYIVGYNNRDEDNPEVVYQQVDSIIDQLVIMTGCNEIVTAISGDYNFRSDIYKVQRYKGNRPDKPEFIEKWKIYIEMRLNKYNLEKRNGFEADDIICSNAECYREQGVDYVVCSPDKDLRQIPGKNYWIKENSVMQIITEEEAYKYLCLQALMGDTTDNVCGVPGMGSVKAHKLLQDATSPVEYQMLITSAYIKYYGPYYGPIIAKETWATVMLLCKAHPIGRVTEAPAKPYIKYRDVDHLMDILES